MQHIAVDELVGHPKNDYYFDAMEGQKWEEFLESVRTSGVIEPLVVTQDKVIVSGHQRVRACKELGIATVLCDIRIYDDKNGRSKGDWIEKDLIETNVRQRGSVGGSELKAIHRVDRLREIYHIGKGGDMKSANSKINSQILTIDSEPTTADETLKAAGVDRSFEKQFSRLRDLIPESEELLASGRITASTAASIIGRLPPDEQLELIESLPEAEKLTAKAVQQYLDLIQKQKDEAQKKISEYQARVAELDKDHEDKAQRVIALQDELACVKAKKDPEFIAEIHLFDCNNL